jgi:hypothetical protein
MAEQDTLISTPLGRTSFSIEGQSSNNLDITEAAERGVSFEKGFTEQSLVGSRAVDWFQQASAAIRNEPKLSAKEANEKYGVNGVIQFEEAIPESLAKARRDRALQSRERDAILEYESQDNTGLQNVGVVVSQIGGALADPTTVLPIAGPTGNLLKAAAGMKVLESASALRGGLIVGAELLSSQAPKAPLLAGAVRGVMDVTLPNAVTEGFLYDNAMKNSYDYNTGLTVAFIAGSIPLAAGLGAFGTKMSAKAFNQGQKNTASIFGVMGDYEKGLQDAYAFVERSTKYDVTNKKILDGIVTRQMAGLLDGAPMSQDAIRATLRLSDQTDDVQRFITNLQSGRYGSVIDEKTGRMLAIDDVANIRRAGADFKAFVINSADNVLSAGATFRTLANVSELGIKYGADINSIGKVDKLIKNLAQKVTELQTQIQKKSKDLGSVPTGQRAAKNSELDSLTRQLEALTKDTEDLKVFKTEKSANKLDDLISKTELKDYTQVTSDTFRADYKKLRDRIRGRKIKSADNFFSLSEDSQRDLYKLYTMLGEDVGQNRSLQDLLKFNDEELLMRHQNGIYKAELGTMSREQAIKILQDEYLSPEIQIRQAAKELSDKVEKEVTEYRDFELNSVEDLRAELETYVGDMSKLDPEIKAEIDTIEEQFIKESNFESGKVEAWNCVMRGFING